MLVIGRALMAKPKLLLMDESSLGIAPKLVQDITRSIVAINRDENLSVLLVEQNSRMAFRISHRAYALATGSVAAGRWHAYRTNVSSRFIWAVSCNRGHVTDAPPCDQSKLDAVHDRQDRRLRAFCCLPGDRNSCHQSSVDSSQQRGVVR